MTEFNERYLYADFNVREKVVEYFPGGGRYASANRAGQTFRGGVQVLFGIAILLATFWKEISKMKI